MLNTINKVNPGNRINFTKLRKGGQIPKFESPAGGVQKVFTNTDMHLEITLDGAKQSLLQSFNRNYSQ